MKKKISVIATMLLVSSTLGLGINQAKADPGSCDASNPCGTWAVVNNAGVVTTTIVCQEAVCGATGSWHGKMPQGDFLCSSCSLVLQLPPDPVTHDTHGSGFFTDTSQPITPDNIVTYDSKTSSFYKGQAPVVVKTETFDDGTSLTTLQTTVMSNKVTFKSSDFQNGEMKFTPVIDETTGATLYIYQYKDAFETVQQLTFDSPKTKEEIQNAMLFNDFSLMFYYWDNFVLMLGDWVMPTL